MFRSKLNPISFLISALFAPAMPLYAFDPNDAADVALLEEKINEKLAPVLAKNKQLLAEVKTAKRGAEIDPADLERVETERDNLQTQLADAQKQLKVATKAAETAEAALKGEQGHTSKLLVDNGLNAALMEAGVKDPTMLEAAAALIRHGNKIEIKVDGETRAAMVGDKSLGDFVKAWSLGDKGKAFVAAPGHSGGGAGGGGSGTPPNPFAKETFNLTEQGKLYITNPALATQMATAAGATI